MERYRTKKLSKHCGNECLQPIANASKASRSAGFTQSSADMPTPDSVVRLTQSAALHGRHAGHSCLSKLDSLKTDALPVRLFSSALGS
jgi:hypothetical protein